MGQLGDAHLDIRLVVEGSITPWGQMALADAATPIGRPEAGEPGVNLEHPRVSRKHACVERHEVDGEISYTLKNTHGRMGIRLYERLLKPGDSAALRHSYTFQIPGVLATPQSPYFLLTLYLNAATTCLAISPCGPPHFTIFGQLVEFTPQEYDLLTYLYQRKNTICPYAEIIAALWAEPRSPERIQAYHELLLADPVEFQSRKNSLDSLISRIRKAIRDASGGIELIETIRGEGLCLRSSCNSSICKDRPT